MALRKVGCFLSIYGVSRMDDETFPTKYTKWEARWLRRFSEPLRYPPLPIVISESGETMLLRCPLKRLDAYLGSSELRFCDDMR